MLIVILEKTLFQRKKIHCDTVIPFIKKQTNKLKKPKNLNQNTSQDKSTSLPLILRYAQLEIKVISQL